MALIRRDMIRVKLQKNHPGCVREAISKRDLICVLKTLLPYVSHSLFFTPFMMSTHQKIKKENDSLLYHKHIRTLGSDRSWVFWVCLINLV